jgi:hypothetical protein
MRALGLGMLDSAMQGQIGVLLQIQVPANEVLNLLCEHVGRILALLEPEQVRNAILGEIRRNLPGVMNRHVEARLTTPGGIRIPQAGERVN